MPTGTPKYFNFPFGVAGDLTAVPDPTQVGGSVSYNQGFGPDYALVNTDPAYLSIPRNQFNQLLFDVTSTLQQMYQNGFPLFITSAMNGGSAYSYSKNAYVYQPSDGNVYYSLVNTNTDVPPTSKWQIVGGPTATSYFNAALDTGSANHYVVAPAPPIGTLAAGDIVILQPTHANTGACDLNVNGGGVLAIKTLQNQDPVAGMIIPTATHLLAYNATTGFWVLLNPALGTAAYSNTGTTTGTIPVLGASGLPAIGGSLLTGLLSGTAATSGKVVFPTLGITLQWGKTTATSSTYSGTFPTAFSGTPYAMVFNSTVATTHTTSTNDCVTALSSTGYTVTGDGIANTFAFYWVAFGPT